MATETGTLTSVVTRLPFRSTLRRLCESLHRRRRRRPVKAKPTDRPPPFAKEEVECILQKSSVLVDQDNHCPAIVEKGEHQPPEPERFLMADVDFLARQTWTEEKERVILRPYDYLASHPGKEFRTLLLNEINAWFEVAPESLAIIIKVVRMLHTASLLIDDIQDNSTLRRGRPVAHNIFGVAQTINSGNFVYALTFQEVQKLRNSAEATDIWTTELLHLHRGQGMDLYWRDTQSCPTEDDYLEMIANKTGGLFRLGAKLMQVESATSTDCVPLVQLIGLIFQIADDYRDLADPDYALNKGFFQDLTEGKFSFPLVHSIRSDPTNPLLLQMLAQKPTDVDIKKQAIAYIESTGSLEYTKQVVAVLIRRAKEIVDGIDQGRGKSKGIYALLDALALEQT